MLAVSLMMDGHPQLIQTNLVGNYNLPNVLVAVTVGLHFGIAFDKIKQAIEGYIPSNSRSQLIQKDTNKIVLDAYNANPTSMRAAIENLATHYPGKRVLMLGGMMELGDESLAEHQSIVDLIAQYAWLEVVLVGGDFAKLQHPYLYFPDSLQAKDWFQQQNFEHTTILVKGSRSMQMERVLNA
jgi:UDP-N-acetylmuramoyl-tripeptide--D-alanyl-D-alanine ligase